MCKYDSKVLYLVVYRKWGWGWGRGQVTLQRYACIVLHPLTRPFLSLYFSNAIQLCVPLLVQKPSNIESTLRAPRLTRVFRGELHIQTTIYTMAENKLGWYCRQWGCVLHALQSPIFRVSLELPRTLLD